MMYSHRLLNAARSPLFVSTFTRWIEVDRRDRKARKLAK